MNFKTSLLALLLPRYRPQRMPDGSTLQQLPPEPVRANYDNWAMKTWTAWRDGGASYHASPSSDEVCPRCYYVDITGNAEYMARNHPDPAARRRWSRTAEIDRRKLEALGEDCMFRQCGQRLQPDPEATAKALGQYFPPR